MSQKERDMVEHDYQISDMDLQTFDKKARQAEERQDAQLSVNVTADIQKEIQEMEQQDMEDMNLFGLPDDLLGQESKDGDAVHKHNTEIRRMVRDLLQQSLEKDPEGHSKNFGMRKSYTAHNPYQADTVFSSLQYEDSVRMRASIVIDQQKSVVTEMYKLDDEGRLSHEERDRLQQVDVLMNRLSDIKIVDAPVLLKLYSLYRYDIVE
jgi:hypothetical protein